MIALGIALVVVGLIFGTFAPPFGYLLVIPGLILIVLFVLGIGRRAAARSDEHRF